MAHSLHVRRNVSTSPNFGEVTACKYVRQFWTLETEHYFIFHAQSERERNALKECSLFPTHLMLLVDLLAAIAPCKKHTAWP
jgi:hypothetical protein